MTTQPLTVTITSRRYCQRSECTLWAADVKFEGRTLGVIERMTGGEPVLRIADYGVAGRAEAWCRANPLKVEFRSGRPPLDVADLEGVVTILGTEALGLAH